MEEFKRDFDCLESQTRQRQFSIYLDSLKLEDHHDQLEGSSTTVESSLALSTTASISDPAIVDSPQPMSELLSPPFYCVLDGSLIMDDII